MSLGNVLRTVAPIAAGYFAPGAGAFLGNATANAVAAGALTGAGIAALSGGDILTSGVMGGLGGYSGGELFGAFNPAAGVDASIKAGTTTAVSNEAMLSPYTNIDAARAAGSAGSNIGMFSNAQAVNLGNPVTNASMLNSMSNAIGANTPVGLNSANAFPSNTVGANTPVGLNSARLPTKSLAPGAYGTVPNPTTGGASRVPGIPDKFSGGYDPSKGVAGEVAYTTPGGYVDRSFSAGLERLGGGSMGAGAMKLGLGGLPVVASAFEPETFTYDQMKEAEAYDPDATLNLLDPELDSGIEDVIDSDSGLRLYAKEGGMIPTYAEGGTVESRSKKGMAGALARNKGIAYTPPASVSAPTPTTALSNNINVAGSDTSNMNLTGGMGSLNVGSGSIGLSPNAIAEAARLKAIEDAKPKTPPMEFVMGRGMMPVGAIESGPAANYNANFGGGYTFKGKRYYAEGGTVETRADQGMRDALARNQGTAYARPTTAPSPITAPSNNIKIAGADNSTSNIGRGVGALNVGSGAIGQSPNAIAEAARLKVIEDAKPKIRVGPSMSGSLPVQYYTGGIGGVGGGRPSRSTGYGGEREYAPGYAQGGMLEGPGDGMSDSLAAQIDGSQPAALSQGEFVVPADVVSHLGNGSSDAGSKRLYAMMDEVRQARTGTEKQGKEINPERYMPA